LSTYQKHDDDISRVIVYTENRRFALADAHQSLRAAQALGFEHVLLQFIIGIWRVGRSKLLDPGDKLDEVGLLSHEVHAFGELRAGG
jgi:hypothetical protein